MADQTRPILPLPLPRQVAYQGPRPPTGRSVENSPNKRGVVDRLKPKFRELERVLDARRAELRKHASGVSPEQVLVFETTRAGASLFLQALQSTELTWLADHAREDVAPDEDYYNIKEPDLPLTTRLFMVMANVKALDQLLHLWKKWSGHLRGHLSHSHAAWADAFAHLRDVRYWGPKDRVAETGLLEDWHARKNSPFKEEIVPLEIELWSRSADARSAAETRIRADVLAANGRVLDAVVIEEISYHAVLAELPIRAVEDLVNTHDLALAKSQDVYLFRPVPQQPPFVAPDDGPDTGVQVARPPERPRGEPTVALLDGLPLERHQLLEGRLIVYDPDDWGADYPAVMRRHGTAMASLIVHGDLGATVEPAARPLFVRPVLRPAELGSREEAPARRLWVDVIHRAVLGLVGTDAARAEAPEVRVVNLSVGDEYRPFSREISPLARLLDWLAWKYKILFVVSAGNHGGIRIEHGDEPLEERALKGLQATHRRRRLLSPAEAINAMTVGALPLDAAPDWTPANPDEVELITNVALPSALSALGRGFRGGIKPELLAPGGRAVYVRGIEDPCEYTCNTNRARLGPGQKAAAPGRSGDLAACEYSFGTSNAAALVSRAAMQIIDVVQELGRANTDLAAIPTALLTKALLVHTSTWDTAAFDVLARAVRNERNQHTFRDHATAYLGYGSLRTERALGCEIHRATLLGGGELELEHAVEHRIPVPAGLNAYTGVRRVVVTLAWFSPIRPSHRAYRVAALEAVVTQIKGLAVDSQDAHARATKRGTLQHRVYEGRRSAVRAGLDDDLIVTVSARPDASDDAGARIPYALAVTLEVDADTPIAVYDEIAARIRPRVRATARAR